LAPELAVEQPLTMRDTPANTVMVLMSFFMIFLLSTAARIFSERVLPGYARWKRFSITTRRVCWCITT